MPELTTRTAPSLASVDPARWDALAHAGSPFLEHGFLRALELSGSVGEAAGWDPVYILVEEAAVRADGAPPRLLGAVPAYIKHHSYGEFIFDWAWARAAIQAGLRYYPKLVVAAPMTPATGPRLLVAPDAPRAAVVDALVAGVREVAEAARCGSIHWLFTTPAETAELAARGFMPRLSFQYHWHHRGWADFDGFLAAMTSRRRKQIRKERQRALAATGPLEWVRGPDLDEEDLAAIDRYYRRTVRQHGGQDYLETGFFDHVHRLMPERMLWARARRGGRTIAGALYFETDAALYGRYWGCDEEVEFLHFEAAYYAAIERCIARGTPRFEAGAQGEHKLIRGFSPAETHSVHWFAHPGFSKAVERFVLEERAHVREHMRELATLLPFRREGEGAGED